MFKTKSKHLITIIMTLTMILLMVGTVNAAAYEATIDDIDFGVSGVGYSSDKIGAIRFNINNTGTETIYYWQIEFSGENLDNNFKYGINSHSPVFVNSTNNSSQWIIVKDGLGVGTYTATATLKISETPEEGSYFVADTATIKFEVVELTKITDLSISGDVVSWDDVDRAAKYDCIFGAWNTILDAPTTELNLKNYADTKKFESGSYKFSVTALDGDRNAITETAEITYDYTSPYAKLATPTNLTWDGMIAKWDAVEGATSYTLYLYQNGYFIPGYAYTVTGGAAQYDFSTDKRLSAENEYKFNVKAHADDKLDSAESELSAVTNGWFSLGTLSNVSISEDGILTWDAYNGADEYSVSVSNIGGNYSETNYYVKERLEYNNKPSDTYTITIYAEDANNIKLTNETQIDYTYTYDTIYVRNLDDYRDAMNWDRADTVEKIVLLNDIDISSLTGSGHDAWYFDSNLTLDLNGHTLTMNGQYIRLNVYTNNLTFTITDSSAGKTGKIIQNETNRGHILTLESLIGASLTDVTVIFDGGTYQLPNCIGEHIYNWAEDATSNFIIRNNATFINGDLVYKIKNISIDTAVFKIDNANEEVALINDETTKFADILAENSVAYTKNTTNDEETKITSSELVKDYKRNETTEIIVKKELLVVETPEFENANYGYADITAKAISLTNKTAESIQIKSVVATESTIFTVVGDTTPTIAAGATDNTSFSIKPVTGLSVGTYETEVTVTDINDKTYTATVSFKVESKALTLKSATATVRGYVEGDKKVTISLVEFNETAPLPELGTGFTVVGEMANDNAGEDKEVTVTVTLTDTNYSLATNTITTTVDISQVAYDKDITGTAYARENVAKTGVKFYLTTLTNLPEEYTFGNPEYIENTDGVLTGTPSVTGSELYYDVASVAAGKTGKIQIPVTFTNYKDDIAVITITTVTKETVTISGATFTSKPYDGNAMSYTGELTVEGDKVDVNTLEWLYEGTDSTIYSNANAPKDVGTYRVTISVPDSNEDYTGSVSYNFEISKKGITAEYEGAKEKEYDGTTTAPVTAAVKLNGVVNGEDVSATATFEYDDADAEGGKTLSTSDITLTGAQKDNYTLRTSSLSIADAIITPKAITLKSATATNRNYVEGNKTVEITAVAFNETDPVPELGTGFTVVGEMIDANAGTGKDVTVAVTLTDTNYSLTSNTITTTVDIAKIAYDKDMTGSASARENAAKAGVKFDLTALTNLPKGYTFGNPEYIENTDGVLTGTPSITGSELSYDVASIAAGKEGKIQIPVNSTNYEIKNAVITITTVVKETVTISGVTFTDKAYDGTAIASTGTLTVTGGNVDVTALKWLYEGTGSTSYSNEGAPVNVGTYKVTISVPDTNVDYMGTVTYSFEITKKELTPEYLGDRTKEYDGTTEAPETAGVKLNGVVGTEDVSATATFEYDDTDAEGGKTLSTSDITLTGAAKDNYTLSTTTLSITDAIITPKALTLKSATATNRNYAEGNKTVEITAVAFNETDPVPELGTGFTVVGEMTDANAGMGKEVTVTVTLVDTNYSLTSNTITTTVDIAKIAYDKDMTGAANVTGNVTKAGVKFDLTTLTNLPEGYTFGNPEYIENTDGVLTGTPSITGSELSYDVASVDVGKTGKIQIPVNSTNYEIKNAVITITTVEKETVTISGLTYTNKEYDGTIVTPTGALTVSDNKVPSGDLLVKYEKFDTVWTEITELSANVGKYKVTYSVSNTNENYTGSKSYEFEITKAIPEVIANNLSQTEGSVTAVTYTSIPAITDGVAKILYEVDSMSESEGSGMSSLNPKVYVENLPTKAGSYKVKLTLSGDSNLEDGDYALGTLVIKKKVYGGGGGSSATTKYTITVKQNDNGKISPETTKVEKGDNQKFEIKASEGYEVEKVLVDGKSVGAVTEYTFEDVKSKHTIEATFKKVEEVVEETWKNPFTDVDEDDWYYEAVKFANENKLFNGVSSTEFGPNVNMTRGMLVTVLYRLEGEPATNRSIPFADVDMSMYYANAISWAKQNNIVNGVDETNFAPNAQISREQLVAILYRYAKAKGMDVSVGEETNILSYDDVNQVSEYAIPAMQWGCGAGIITGRTQSTLAPQGTATRAEVATMLMRFVK